MKKLLYVLSSLALVLSLASCGFSGPKESAIFPSEKPTMPKDDERVDVLYQVEVIDMDGSVLGNKYIHTSQKNSLFEDLKKAFDVEYSDTEYGHFITSINSSIVDPNYGLMLYQNGTLATTGVDGIVLNDNDEIKFVNECFNEDFTDFDKRIDQIVYKFIKNDKELFSGMKQKDHYLLAAMNKMKSLGYSVDFDFISEEFALEILNTKLADVSDTNLFRQVELLKAIDANLDSIKQEVETRDIKPTSSPWTAPFIYGASKVLNVSLKNQEGFDKAIAESIKGIDNNRIEIGDAFSFQSHLINGNSELTSERLMKLLNEQKKYFTKDGLYIPAYHNDPVVSAACAIMGFTTLGVDIRAKEWQVEGRDLVEILLDNVVDGYYFKNSEEDMTYKAITTPQCMAALMNYKMARDLSKTSDFKGVDIFA